MRLEEYIGNEKVKEQVTLSIASALKRNEPIRHMLFAGHPGCGKTTMAKLISSLLKLPLVHVQPSSIKDSNDIITLSKKIGNKNKQNLIFLDEIHEISLKGQEVLGIAMEEGIATATNGYVNKPVKLPRFTIMGATTVPGILSKPFIDRFGLTLSFDFYALDDCEKIVKHYLAKQIPNIPVDTEALTAISTRGRGTPRILERLSDRVIDYVTVKDIKYVTKDVVEHVMKIADIDKSGLTKADLQILKAMCSAGRPVGLENLAAITGEDTKTIATKLEPYMIRKGFMVRTGSGRMLTQEGYEYLEDNGHIE